MPKPPLPDDLQEMLRAPNPCVVASMALDGELHSAATWYEWRDDEIGRASCRERVLSCV
jgi:hypothetical protein